MISPENIEANILNTSAILLVLSSIEDSELMTNFCGTVIDMSDSSSPYSPMIDLSKKTVYMCGDISTASSVDLKVAKRVFIIEQLSHSINNSH